MTIKLYNSRLFITLATAATAIAACGGGSPLDNPPTLANPAGAAGQKLSYAYFERCVNPVLKTPLRIDINGAISVNTCASAGCHDNATGTGGALRLMAAAAPAASAATPTEVRATDMYKNYYSSLGETVVGAPDESRLLNKPLVRGVLHGGGLIFERADTAEAKTIRFWIGRPMPQGQDEFSSAAASMFDATGACRIE
ncbi:MAG: hypothetical protein C0505_03230 [Leptothrix sp. (in: Bacteria)]|nr:hypothetical protein [Leptothrix sp. (in: b-proteobacteria)]